MILCAPNLRSAALVHKVYGYESSGSYTSVDFSLWSKLEHLEFRHAILSDLPSLPRTLKYLDISENIILSPPLPTDESVAMIDLPLLENFACDCAGLNLGVILAVIGPSVKAGNLQTLHISHPPADGYDEFSILPDDFMIPSLQELSLRKCQESEDGILKLLRRCPALRYLDATYTKITGVAVKELMTREVGPLKWLGADGCSCLSSDAVEWARSLGTVVEYNLQPPKRPAGRRFWRDRLST